jgi:hypothetical protein
MPAGIRARKGRNRVGRNARLLDVYDRDGELLPQGLKYLLFRDETQLHEGLANAESFLGLEPKRCADLLLGDQAHLAHDLTESFASPDSHV